MAEETTGTVCAAEDCAEQVEDIAGDCGCSAGTESAAAGMDATEVGAAGLDATEAEAAGFDETEAEAASMSSEEREDLARAHEQRAWMYGLLSRLYRVEVDPVFLDQLRAMRFPASTGNDAMDEGYRLLAGYLGRADAGTLTELAVDYVRAFIGHGIDGHAAAYPFESVYTSAKRLMMQGARDEVLALYRAEGVDKSADWKDGEDHVALELEFMKTLAERAAKALHEGDEAEAARLLQVQHAFLDDHLRKWLPTFTRDMGIFAKTDLYLGLARLTAGFLQVEEEFMAEVA